MRSGRAAEPLGRAGVRVPAEALDLLAEDLLEPLPPPWPTQEPDLGSGRIAVSEIEAPNMLVNLI